jgi:probable phosphoglycerate mutase
MTSALPEIHMIRHGETAWTKSGQHTGLTDIPLTERGEDQARQFGGHLQGRTFAHVFTSPLQRAKRTCELAGFGAMAQIDPDLVEWNYGEYEGLTRAEILERRPGWQVFHDGCPRGESVAEVGARADRVIARLRALDGDTLLFSSGHFTRAFAARWLGLAASGGRWFLLSTTTLSVLGYDHDKSEPVIRLWNDIRPGID